MARIVGGLVVAACTGGAIAQDVCPGDIIKLLASDGEGGDAFGYSVAIDGDSAIVGAFGDDDRGTDSGAAYIYQWDGMVWNEVAKLTAPDGATDDRFGYAVAIGGDIAIVGAYQDDDLGIESGSAYVFERVGNAWTQTSKLTASGGQAGDQFGFSVAISGDTAVIGAYQDDDRGTDSGSAYVFERVAGEWNQTAILTAADGADGDQFGSSVAISNETAIVGTPLDDDRGTDSGSAYVFERDGNAWTQTAKLLASDGQAGDLFGGSVAISGETSIAGAIRDDDMGTDSGSAYVFERVAGVWSQTTKLTAPDGEADDEFGISVSISGDTALVGARFDDDTGASSGSAYVFERVAGVWNQTTKLTAPRGQAADLFGQSLAVHDEFVIVGAYRDDDRGNNSGSVYIWDGVHHDCCADIDRNGILDALDFFTFLDFFVAGDPHADFTGDGVIDGDDFFVYLDTFAAGCP